MSKKAGLLFTLFLFVLSSCAGGITREQKREMVAYKAKGMYKQEKNPMVGALLGGLPGGGSLYAREYGIAIINVLLYPVSAAWDPISGVQGSERINYYATREYVATLQRREKKELNRMLSMGKVDTKLYLIKQQEIEDKYSPVY